MSENEAHNVDDALGFNLAEAPVDSEFRKPARVSRARNLKETHLTSIRGLPYIRQSAQKRARKNMNHKDEFKNLTNFLTFYQIWGHNLFPKAKFPDFLEMCTTAGSERSVKLMRRGFIEEDAGKVRDQMFSENFVPLVDPTSIDVLSGDSLQMTREEEERLDQQDFEDRLFEQAAEARRSQTQDTTQTITEKSTASIIEKTTGTSQTSIPQAHTLSHQSQPVEKLSTGNDFDDDGFDDDDDDDFLANIGSNKTGTDQAQPVAKISTEPDPSMEEFNHYEDEYEAEMEFLREQGL